MNIAAGLSKRLERETFSREVLDAVGANIAVLDRNGVIVAVNRAWQEFACNNGDSSGGSATGVGVNYLAVVKASHGASTEGAAEALVGIQDVLAGRNAEFTIEYPCHSPNEQRWFMLHATPLAGDAGGAVLAHINITERKRAELALHDSELRYRRLFEAAKDGVLILDAETGMVVDVNPFLIELLGFSREQFLQKKVWELGFLKDIFANQANFSELQEKGYVRYEDLPLKTADGRQSHVEFVSNVYLVDHQKVIQCNIRDITERKQTEEQIERLSRFPSENPNPVLRVSAQGVLEYANARSDSILPAIGAAVGGAVNAEWQARIGETFAKEHPVNIEFQAGDRTFGATLTPVVGHGYVNLYAQDITEHKRAEEMLRDSEARYRVLFESSADGILIADLETKTLSYANPALCRMLGYTDEELRTMGIADIHPKEDLQWVIAEFEAQARGEKTFAADLPCLRKDGTILYADVNATTAVIDRRTCLVGFFRDDTERKRAEEMLRQSEARYRSYIDVTGQIAWVTNAAGEIEEDVPSWREFSGLTYEEAKGLGWTKALHPDDRERTLKAWNEAVATKSTYEVEYRMRRHDGVYRDLLARGFPVRNEDGSIREWIGTCTDITERKRVEAERAALDEQLRQAQKMESVGQLAGGVAHDFNNILTGISGYTELALERLDTASPMREDLAEVLRLAKRAAELTRQLLAFSRRQTLQPQVLNINDMIADTAKMLKRVLSEDIDLHFAPAPDLGNVRADPMQMEQVLMNLAINARDAMPAGGKLTIETANVELDEDYADHHVSVIPGRYVMMAVSDTGHGMDAATRSRLFEPFFTTKEKSKGTGLGLATAYGIVKQHGGNIWVYTEPGNGATFKIYLPRVEEAASATEPAAEPNVQRGEETILVVEDEPAVRAVAERALKARGYALLTASSAEEAEGLFSEHSERISLLLTDVVLPGINGPRLYDRLRIANPGLKVLYMSGHTGNATVHQGVLDAGVAFMQKPFTLEMIARKVRQVLDS